MKRPANSRRSALLAAVLALAAAGPPERASADPDASAQPASTAYDDEIEVIRIVAVGTGELPRDATSFSTEIDLERFDGEQTRLEDLLAQTVGVQIRRFGGAGERAEISIRGFSSTQVVVLLDGVKLNGGLGSGVDLSSIPLSQLEAVEVSRGGGSLTAGSGAMGGVVELRTRRPDFPSALLSVQGGSFGTVNTNVYATRPGRVIDLGFGYSGFVTDGDFEFARTVIEYPGGQPLLPPTKSAMRINNEHEQHDANLSIGFDLGSAGYLLAQQRLGHTIRGEPGLDRESASVNAGQQRFAEQRILRSITQLRWEEIELSMDGARMEASLSHRLERSKFSDPDPVLGSSPIDDKFEDMSTTLSLQPQWFAEGFAAEHRIRGELLLTRDALDASEAPLRDRFGLGLMLRDDAQFFAGRLLIAPGVRFDWTDESGSQLIPSLGVVITPVAWLRFKGNVDRSFRNPSFQDLYLPDRGFISGNPDLDPERAINYDLGFELLLDSIYAVRDIRLAASVFRSEIENSIIWLRVSPFKIRPENSDNATTEGVEISASIRLGPYVKLSANHTELRAELKANGFRLPGRASRETHARLEVGRPGVLKAIGEMQRTGSISVAENGTYTIPSRISWNASLAFELSHLSRKLGLELGLRRLWIHAAVENIGDIAIRDSLTFPQPGRSLRMGMEAQW